MRSSRIRTDARRLGETVARCSNVTLHLIALGSREDVLTLFIPSGDESMASLSDWTEGRAGAIARSTCDVRTIDGLVGAGVVAAPDFIKCDVEGAEGQVFQGARGLLDRAEAPCVLYEANVSSARAFGASICAATRWLASLVHPAFRFFHVQPRGTLVSIPPELHTGADNFNLLAVPAARAERLE